jgi:phospholipid/cholesterol/gamma-HCH transport system substrate-binding protein
LRNPAHYKACPVEFRASHFAVGMMMLLIACSIPVIVLVASRSGGHARIDHYIRFVGSVAGLQVGSNVLFGGIPVGRVTSVTIDPDNTTLARIDISVDSNVAIYENSKATMAQQGISGSIQVDISRGGATHGRLLKPGEEIAARYSPFSKLVASLPTIEAKGGMLMDRLTSFVSPEDITLSGRILDNVAKLRGRFAADAPAIDGIVAEASNAMGQFARAWSDIQEAGKSLGPLAADAQATEREIGKLGATASTVGADVSGFVEANRRQIEDFASNGLAQMPLMLNELHELGRNLDHLWAQIRQDPARFFLSSPEDEGFTPPAGVNQHH